MMVVTQPNKENHTAAKPIVDKWCCVFGIPDRCLTDGGKEYQSKLWDATCELLDIERSKTTAFHPECDGHSERLVRTQKECITAYVNDLQDDWDLVLPQLGYAYNSIIHGTTNNTPFEAMFGRKPKLSIDLIYPQIETEHRDTATSPQTERIETFNEFVPRLNPEAEDYVNGLKLHLTNIGKSIEKARDVKMEKAKCSHDRSIKKRLII